MDFAAKPLRMARDTFWEHKLRTIFTYDLNDRILNTLMLLLNFHFCQENIVVLIVVKTTKRTPPSFTTAICKSFKSNAEH